MHTCPVFHSTLGIYCWQMLETGYWATQTSGLMQHDCSFVRPVLSLKIQRKRNIWKRATIGVQAGGKGSTTRRQVRTCADGWACCSVTPSNQLYFKKYFLFWEPLMDILETGGEKKEPVRWGRKQHPPCRRSILHAHKACKYKPRRVIKPSREGQESPRASSIPQSKQSKLQPA